MADAIAAGTARKAEAAAAAALAKAHLAATAEAAASVAGASGASTSQGLPVPPQQWQAIRTRVLDTLSPQPSTTQGNPLVLPAQANSTHTTPVDPVVASDVTPDATPGTSTPRRADPVNLWAVLDGMRSQQAPATTTPTRQEGPPPERDPPVVMQRERRVPELRISVPARDAFVTASPLTTPRSPRPQSPAQIAIDSTPRLSPPATPHDTAIHGSTGPVYPMLMQEQEPPAIPQEPPASGSPSQAAGLVSTLAGGVASLVSGVVSYVAGEDLLPAATPETDPVHARVRSVNVPVQTTPPDSSDSDESGTHGSVETRLSSRRWETNEPLVRQPRLPVTEEVPLAGGAGVVVRPEPEAAAPPPSRLTVLRAGLAHGLGDLHFSTTDPERLAQQRTFEARYLDRAAQILERREKAFGTTQPYQLGQPMRTQVRMGLLPAAYEGFQSFVTSAFRSPSGGALGLSVRDNQNFFPIDQALTTSLLQGFMAYVAAEAMAAVSNRATLSNMPKVARNNFDGLFYQQEIQPDTVLLVVNGRTKEYMRADDPRACSAEAQAEQVGRKLSSIKMRQDLLDGKSFAFAAVPLLTGGFNTLRRFLSSPAVLASPMPLFVTSALASGSASGVVKLGLEVGKTAAQVEIDDLMGGRQSVNLFRLSRPHADIEPLRWADARRLHGFLAETVRESLSLAKEASRTWLHSAADLSYRYILVNGIANMSGVGIGGMMGQVFRPGRQFGPMPGESPHSRANIAAQMVQSTFGDAIWRGLKEVMKGRELDNNASLKLRRGARMAEQLKEAERAQGALRAQVARIPEDSAIWAAHRSAAPVPGGPDIESHGNLRSRLLQDRPMDLDTLRGLRRELVALDLRGAGEPAQTDRNELKQHLDKIIKPLSCRAATQQWLQPRE